jgi:hypothetical protein
MRSTVQQREQSHRKSRARLGESEQVRWPERTKNVHENASNNYAVRRLGSKGLNRHPHGEPAWPSAQASQHGQRKEGKTGAGEGL